MKRYTHINNFEPMVDLFKIVSSEAVLDEGSQSNRWLYVVQPAIAQVFDTDNLIVSVETNAPYLEAWNVYEYGNTTTTAMGLPATTIATLQPIPDDALVPGTYRRGEERVRVMIWYPNQWECNE